MVTYSKPKMKKVFQVGQLLHNRYGTEMKYCVTVETSFSFVLFVKMLL